MSRQGGYSCSLSFVTRLWKLVGSVGINDSVFSTMCLPKHCYITVYFPLVLLQWHTEYSTGYEPWPEAPQKLNQLTHEMVEVIKLKPNGQNWSEWHEYTQKCAELQRVANYFVGTPITGIAKLWDSCIYTRCAVWLNICLARRLLILMSAGVIIYVYEPTPFQI